jgi:hypothetical protein
MAKITINEAVHVSIVIDGETIERDLTAGDVDVEQAIADLLISQNLASLKVGKKTTPIEPIVVETNTATETPEA